MNPIFDMLKHAMQAERDGFFHYQTAGERTGDPKAREIFLKLAQDELTHHKLLEEMLAALEKGERPTDVLDTARAAFVPLTGPSPIFSEDFRTRIKEKHFEMSALSIGMTLEQNGINYYSEMEKKADVPELKKLLKFLVQWEQSHLEALSAQARFFHESYMQGAHFSPF
jgi:rubrerythrin